MASPMFRVCKYLAERRKLKRLRAYGALRGFENATPGQFSQGPHSQNFLRRPKLYGALAYVALPEIDTPKTWGMPYCSQLRCLKLRMRPLLVRNSHRSKIKLEH